MIRRIGRSALAVLACSLFLMTGGCGETPTSPATGTIYGKMIYPDGNPASGITVLVEETGMTSITDAQGRFVMNGLLAVDRTGMGRYYTVRGFGMREMDSVGFLVAHFKVKGQQSYGLGTVVVQKTGMMFGAVYLDGESSDHSGVMVRIENTSLMGVTKADGTFMIGGVPAFRGYRVLCEKMGYETGVFDHLVEGLDSVPLEVPAGGLVRLGAMTILKKSP